MYAIKRPAVIAPNQENKDRIARILVEVRPVFFSIFLYIFEAKNIPEPIKKSFARKGRFVDR